MQGRRTGLIILLLTFALQVLRLQAQVASGQVTEMPYRVVPNFLKLPSDLYFSEVSGVAMNSKGHIFVFQRGSHPLVEFDEDGNFVRTMGEGLFTRPHGLRIDSVDNIWVTDNGAHFVLKLSPEGRISMVPGQQDVGMTRISREQLARTFLASVSLHQATHVFSCGGGIVRTNHRCQRESAWVHDCVVTFTAK
jgi:hypothetical protein